MIRNHLSGGQLNRQNKSFSLNDFKSWLSQQPDLSGFFDLSNRTNPGDELIGCEVHAKVSGKKLLEKIQSENVDPEILVEDLLENGGVVVSLDGKNLLIEVESGSFYLPRFCVRIVKSD